MDICSVNSEMLLLYQAYLVRHPVDNFATVVGENPSCYGIYHCGLSMDCQLSAGHAVTQTTVTASVLVAAGE